MKIDTLNIKDHGQQNVAVPKGAKFVSAVLLSGVVQVNYAYEGDGNVKELADLRVVYNGEDYPKGYIYLDALVNPNNKQVTHCLYKPSGAGLVVTPV